jgi:photosystem II stability/assembly factor-like uncharacterized protein
VIRLLVFLLLIVPAFAERWKLAYFYDEEDTSLRIVDLQFASEKRGIAIGQIVRKNGKTKPVSLITTDGGAKWNLIEMDEAGFELSFIDDSRGWMAANNSVWRTDEGGRNWKKIATLKGIRAIWFLDEQRGFAAGENKQVWSTTDGGKKWDPIAAAQEPASNPEYTVYDVIAFAGKVGLIGGAYVPPTPFRRRQQEPAWLDPESAMGKRQVPALMLALDSRDGGQNWKPQTAPVFGRLTDLSLTTEGVGLSLFRFQSGFDWPSEVFKIDWTSGRSDRTFREKDVVVSSVKAFSRSSAFLAGFTPVGKLYDSPVPGKVRIYRTSDYKTWTEIPADYRAVANRVILAGTGPDNLWAATDTGMILRLTQ